MQGAKTLKKHAKEKIYPMLCSQDLEKSLGYFGYHKVLFFFQCISLVGRYPPKPPSFYFNR